MFPVWWHIKEVIILEFSRTFLSYNVSRCQPNSDYCCSWLTCPALPTWNKEVTFQYFVWTPLIRNYYHNTASSRRCLQRLHYIQQIQGGPLLKKLCCGPKTATYGIDLIYNYYINICIVLLFTRSCLSCVKQYTKSECSQVCTMLLCNFFLKQQVSFAHRNMYLVLFLFPKR